MSRYSKEQPSAFATMVRISRRNLQGSLRTVITYDRMYSLSRTRCGNPKQGRMLAVDNFVQSPYSSQGYNRYSYVHNSPLGAVDPTGEIVDYLNDAIAANSWDPYGWGQGQKFDGTVVFGVSSDGAGVNIYAGGSLSSNSSTWVFGGNTQTGRFGGGVSSFGLPSYTQAPSAASFSIDWGGVNRANVSSQGWNNGGVDVNGVLERASRFLFNQRLHSSRTYNLYSTGASSDLIAQGPSGNPPSAWGLSGVSFELEIAYPEWIVRNILGGTTGIGIEVGILNDGYSINGFISTKTTKDRNIAAFAADVGMLVALPNTFMTEHIGNQSLNGPGVEQSFNFLIGGFSIGSDQGFKSMRPSNYVIGRVSVGPGFELGFPNWETQTTVY